jgi:hypothetical protein
MKLFCISFCLGIAALVSARADLTIVQKVEGMGPITEMTFKIKGDKARIDVSPQITTIFDGKTGGMINLMNDQKLIVRLSAEKMKAAAEMMRQHKPKKEEGEKAKLVATGKKEVINGYETEQYVYDGSDFKATYWIATNYPDGAAILKQLQTLKAEAWDSTNTHIPDYRDFPGLPIKTVMSAGGKEYTTTLTSIKQDTLSDSEFALPKDYKEMTMPDIFGGTKAPGSAAAPTP